MCVVVVLTSMFFVSRGWFMSLTFKCPEVGLGFSLFDDTRTLMPPSRDCLSKTFEDEKTLRFSQTLVQTSEGTQWEQPGLRKESIQPSSSTLFNNFVFCCLLFVCVFAVKKNDDPSDDHDDHDDHDETSAHFLCVLSSSWLGCFLCPEVGLGIYF